MERGSSPSIVSDLSGAYSIPLPYVWSRTEHWDLNRSAKDPRECLVPIGRCGPLIIPTPILLIACPREVVQKLPLGHAGFIPLDLVFLQSPGNASRLRNQLAHITAIGTHNSVLIGQDRFKLQAV